MEGRFFRLGRLAGNGAGGELAMIVVDGRSRWSKGLIL